MSNWVFAGLMVVCAVFATYNYRNAQLAYEHAQSLIEAAEARHAQEERQRQIDAAKGAFNERAETGGDTGLSDYVSDMASELWP